MSFRASDTVLHRPSGETWTLCCDQIDGLVIPSGWPACLAKSGDCVLIEAATDPERLAMLRRASLGPGTFGGNRSDWATRQLNDAVIADLASGRR